MVDLFREYGLDDQPTAQPAPPSGGVDLFSEYGLDGAPAQAEQSFLQRQGQRGRIGLAEGFEATLAGQTRLNRQDPGFPLRAQAEEIQSILDFAQQSGGELPMVMPPQFAGQSLEDLQAEQQRLIAEADTASAPFREQRQGTLEDRGEIIPWHEEEGMLGKLFAGTTALGSRLIGGTPSPENVLAFGRGATVAGRAARGAAGGAGVAGATEPLIQQMEMDRGERDAFSNVEWALNTALGGAIGSTLNITPDLFRGLIDFTSNLTGKPREQVTAEDIAGIDPEVLMAQIQEISEGTRMAPEQVQGQVEAATGTAAPAPLGQGMAPPEARQARRQRERELGQLFEETDVLRRDDVDITPEGLQVREDALPARDPTGEQANPDTFGPRAAAQYYADELGVRLDEQGLRAAARDIAADPEADPRAIVRDYSQEARGQAFDLAESRRQRREQDLATGERTDSSDYRAAAIPAERAEMREVTLLGATRSRDGQLTGGEAVEVIARDQRQGPDGEIVDMARIQRGDNPPEWVRAAELETVEIPANTRMAQQARAETVEPPEGVGTARGDAPEVLDPRATTQGPQPRRAVDRISDPEGLRRGQFMEGERPEPPGSTPRTGETFDAEPPVPRLEQDSRRLEGPDRSPRTEQPAAREIPPMPPRPQTPEPPPRRPAARDVEDFSFEGDAPPARLEDMADYARSVGVRQDDIDTTLRLPDEADARDRLGDLVADAQARRGQTDTRTRQPSTRAEAGRSAWRIDPQRDSLAQAVAKAGGIRRSDAIQDGLDPADIAGQRGGRRVYTREGMSPDAMRERMVEEGYARPDETLNEFMDRMRNAENEYSAEGQMRRADQQAEEDFRLQSEDEGQRQKREAQQRESRRKQADSQRQEDQRAQANRDADDFVLEGSDRPADRAAARGQNDLFGASPRRAEPEQSTPRTDPEPKAAGEAEGDGTIRSGGVQFYSGMPLDKLAEAIGKMTNISGWSRKFREDFEWVRQLMSARKERDPKEPGAVRKAVGLLLNDTHDAIVDVAKRRNSATAREIADKIFAEVGSGRGIQETYWEGYSMRVNHLLNRLADIEANLPDVNLDQLRRQIQNPNARRGKVGEAATKLAKLFREQLEWMRERGIEVGDVGAGYLPRVYNKEAIIKKRAQFLDQAEKMYQSMGESAPRAKAESFWEYKAYGEAVKPGERRPKGAENWQKERRLDERADEYLADFIESDPFALARQYLDQSSRRGALAQQFGDNWDNWPDMVKRLREEGVPQNEIDVIASNAAAGVGLAVQHSGAQAVSSWVRTFTALGTLPWSTLTNIPEVMMPIVRTSGDVRTTWATLKNVATDSARFITRLPASERDVAWRDFAEVIGAVSKTWSDQTIVARMVGMDPIGKKQTQVIQGFYRNIGMTQLQERNIARSIEVAHIYMDRLVKDLGGKSARRKRNAEYELRDLGITEFDSLKRILNSREKGQAPDYAKLVDDKGFKQYRTALTRFGRQTALQPDFSNRPKWASHPFGAMVFQLLAFPFAFSKTVLGRGRNIARNAVEQRDYQRMALLMGMAPGMAAIALMQDMQGQIRKNVRDEVYGRETEMTTGARVERALSFAGLFGKLDPLMQAISGTRYNRTLESSLLGVGLGRFADAANTLIRSGLRNSPNTNTAERKLAATSYDMMAMPLAQAFLSNAPGGMLTSGLAVGVPLFKEKYITALAGPEDPRDRDPIKSTFEELAERFGPKGPQPGRAGSRETSRSSGRSTSRETSRSSGRSTSRETSR